MEDPTIAFCIQGGCRKAPSLELRAENEEEKLQWSIKLTQAIAIAKVFDDYVKLSILGQGGQVSYFDYSDNF